MAKWRSRRSGTRFGPAIVALVVVWLVIGAIAAGQRHYYTNKSQSCAKTSTIAVTVLAGPLNYLGVNPKAKCPHVPQPSK